jgi:hypothetical protein
MSDYAFACIQSNVNVNVRGVWVTVKPSDVRHATDPVVLTHPALFSDVPTNVQRFPGWNPADVEQATAAPGERRIARSAN